MTPHEFIAKWRNGGDERRDAQPFFEDLCRLVGHPTPREADPSHTWYTYEAGASKTSGGNGWADVWKRGFFALEAKGTDRSLEKAYEQLKMYADALQNPPLLVVTDLKTIIVHTNFTNTVKREIRFTVEDLANFETRQILEAVFNNPDALRPGVTRSAITQEAAQKFAALARSLRDRGHEPHTVAHFLNRLLFCMFAEDIGLLPNNLFTKLVSSSQAAPDLFEKRTQELFAAMHKGGDVAFENVEWFNGGLFDDDAVLRLEPPDLKILLDACRLDWSAIEPSIFGTLFERGLDPSKRSQLGAHYTDPATIMKIIEPVISRPLLAEWDAVRTQLEDLVSKAGIGAPTAKDTPAQKAAKTRALSTARATLNTFLERLRAFTVLDPACGSGNFLYLALRTLKDIERRALIEAEMLGLGRQFPQVGPACVRGIELNAYAAELARVTIWIGEVQCSLQSGFGIRRNPILQPLQQIEQRDALLDADGRAASWPPADAVVGNPPFVGDKRMAPELGREYVDRLRAAYAGSVPGGADLVCYWFAKADEAIARGTLKRAGLVATNSIRGGRNRQVLDAIATNTRIFDAWSDEDWINEGAAVRVSIACFGESSQEARLDGERVPAIFPDLTAAAVAGSLSITTARKISSNAGVAFSGIQKTGPFEIDGPTARAWLALPNPNGKPNSDVVRPWANGLDIVRRPRDMWIVDFGTDVAKSDAAFYDAPFAHVEQHVKPTRVGKREARTNECWWLFQWSRPVMRKAISGLARFIVTPEVSKHRVFAWLDARVVPDKNLVVIARDDDLTFGILHSRFHIEWSLRLGTSLEDRPRYTATSCFETFPFPEGLDLATPFAQRRANPRAAAIELAAQRLVAARDAWLNPPEWTQRLPEVVPGLPDRLIAVPAHAAALKQRTLTNLYNTRPTWLSELHAALDAAVAQAYGWPADINDQDAMARLLALNHAIG